MRLAPLATPAEPRLPGPVTTLLACLALASATVAGCSERVAGITEGSTGGGRGGGSATGGQGGANAPPCVGVDPGDEARTDPEESAVSTGEDAPEIPTTIPLWRLRDFQPQSCGYDATYGADAFAGKVVVIAMLQGWCTYCQSQALNLDRMRLDLNSHGHKDIVFMAINGTSSDNDEDRGNLSGRCAFPLFQDVENVNAWQLHAGHKDDIVIYDADGNLAKTFRNVDDVVTDLAGEEGYNNIRDAILEVIAL